eukprot:CAMPEP_0197435286 /NCGR_PEP_ID=MMETSP1175-20131217/2903_1 /TAXON_ID=1003142 /ORGANISM="Triceratium dubium, Strain CCMP147" /LENGTH=136 /DNA_ID=CAMNT_0042964285 /DNA_START=164 /DNA_END=574 /DNA_ORIENTATION=+
MWSILLNVIQKNARLKVHNHATFITHIHPCNRIEISPLLDLLPSSEHGLLRPVKYRHLYQKSKNVTIGLRLFDELGPEVVRSRPGAEVTNVLAVVADRLAADLVQALIPKDDLCPVHRRAEDSKLSHLSTHMQDSP